MKDGFYVEGELPVADRVSVIGRWDGLRRDGNVLATSALSSASSLYRYTAAAAVKLHSGIRLKSSVEYYRFSDFPDELAVHLGVATPF